MQFSHRFIIYFIMLLRMFLMHAFIMSPYLSLAFCNNFHLFCWNTNLSFNIISYFPFWQLFNFDSSLFHLFLSFLKLTAAFPANGRNMPDNMGTLWLLYYKGQFYSKQAHTILCQWFTHNSPLRKHMQCILHTWILRIPYGCRYVSHSRQKHTYMHSWTHIEYSLAILNFFYNYILIASPALSKNLHYGTSRPLNLQVPALNNSVIVLLSVTAKKPTDG